MSLSGSTKPIIFGFVLAISITLTLLYNGFAAAHSVGGFRGFGSPVIHRQQFLSPRQQFFSPRFNRVVFNSPRFNRVGFNRVRFNHRVGFNRFGFNDFGFSGVGGFVDEQPFMTIEQVQPAATTDPLEPVKGMYVQPRWVDGGYGVQVSQPGYWTYPRR